MAFDLNPKEQSLIKLTIGIPTFNRVESLSNVLKPFINLRDPDFKMLIINDASDDETYSFLNRVNNKSIKCIHNEVRLGFCRNFIKLIEKCETEYLLVTSDDDFIVKENYFKMKDFFNNNCDPIGFISTNFFLDGKLYRGTNERRAISTLEYRNSCNHMPGIIFNCPVARNILAKWGNKINTKHNYYPQAFLVLLIISYGYRALYEPIEIIKMGYENPSGIAFYSTLNGRIIEYMNFKRLLEDIYEDPDIVNRDQILILYRHHYELLFRGILNGIRTEFGDELARLCMISAKSFFKCD